MLSHVLKVDQNIVRAFRVHYVTKLVPSSVGFE